MYGWIMNLVPLKKPYQGSVCSYFHLFLGNFEFCIFSWLFCVSVVFVSLSGCLVCLLSFCLCLVVLCACCLSISAWLFVCLLSLCLRLVVLHVAPLCDCFVSLWLFWDLNFYVVALNLFGVVLHVFVVILNRVSLFHWLSNKKFPLKQNSPRGSLFCVYQHLILQWLNLLLPKLS